MACQKPRDADVFIEIGPVDSLAAADQAPVGAFSGVSGGQAWKPSQGNGQDTAVEEFHDQQVVPHLYRLRPGRASLNR